MADRNLDVRLRVRNQRAFNADTRKAERGIKSLGSATGRADLRARAGAKAMGGLGTALRAVGRAGLYAGGALAAGGVVLGKRSIDEWREAQKVTRDTANSIRVTGNAANVSAKQVSDLSSRISEKTGIDDEAIQKGSNLLLTFTKIRNEAGEGNKIFDRATQAAVDMSAKGFGSIESSSKMLGKALNDPIKGITAMSRAGVSFTENEKEKITALVESGQLLEAQEKIMSSVEKQGIKGTAAAIADPIDKLKTSWANVEESIGGVIGPPAMILVNKFAHGLNKIRPEIDKLNKGLTEIWDPKHNRSFGQNLALSRSLIGDKLGPVWDDLKDDLDDADVGGKLAAVVGDAIPVMAEAAGKGGGALVKAFVKGWWDADLGGKLFTLGLLGARVGVFTKLGGKAASKFIAKFAPRLAAMIGIEMAAEGAIGGALTGSKVSRLGTKSGRIFGRAFGLSAAAAAIFFLAEDEFFEDPVGYLKDSITGHELGDSKPTPGRTSPKQRRQNRRFRRNHPNYYKPGGANAIPGLGGPRRVKRVGTAGAASVPTVIDRTVHKIVLPDGRVLAEEVGRHTADRRARR